jgi:hypothetical protein
MIRVLIMLFLLIISPFVIGQATLITEGKVVNNSQTGSWEGENIPRNEPVSFIFRNNSITSVNTSGYMLQAGDESPVATNNNLDGQVITGNKFLWNGVNSSNVITHGLFAGYNINSVIKYNYLDKVPYGIIFKSGTNDGTNMTFTRGGAAYNIWKNGKFAGRVKGINGVSFLNNTFYSGDGLGWYLLLISANMDRTIPSPSIGTKVFNNIFYTTSIIPMIKIESSCLTGFESDYNIFFSTAGEPVFEIDDETVTWDEWRALGYDEHSVIMDPDFINTATLIPRVRLDFGKNLGAEWQTGLSVTAAWIAGSPPATANQDSTWQVGAHVHESDEPELPDNSETLKIFPNPNKGRFTIEFAEPPERKDFYVINKIGAKVYDGMINEGERSKELDLSFLHLNPGPYILVITGNGGRQTKKIILH